MKTLIRKLLSLALAASLLGLSACVSAPAGNPNMVDYAYVPAHLPSIKSIETYE